MQISQSITTSTLTNHITRIACSVALALIGVSLLYFTGFSPMEVMHNAAHDTRHVMVFPCH